MSITPTSTKVGGPLDPRARADRARAWLAAATIIVGLVTAAVILTALDLEQDFTTGSLIRGGVMIIVALLAWAALTFGLRAWHAGSGSGLLAAILACVVGGFFILMGIVSTVAHLAGFE